MKNYMFNDCSVCINPETVEVCDGITIYYCDMGDFYLYGLRIECSTRSASFLPMLGFKKTDKLFKKAIADILQHIDVFEREDKNKHGWCNKARRECAKFLNKNSQLTLEL